MDVKMKNTFTFRSRIWKQERKRRKERPYIFATIPSILPPEQRLGRVYREQKNTVSFIDILATKSNESEIAKRFRK
jgi:hypothetical protein